MNSKVTDEDTLKYCLSQINEFEKTYIKDNFINYKKYKPHTGYLIKLESYNDIKKTIGQYYNKWTNASTILKSISTLEEIEFKTSTYLINMLLNGNKYIIINNKIWELFGNKERKDKASISYSIESSYITFVLDDNVQVSFHCRSQNNIIDNSTISQTYNNYSKFESNYQKIESIYQEISDYYDFENELKKGLNYDHYFQDYAYLVDISTLKKWKEITNYDGIKKLIDAKVKKNQIMNKIILYEEINKKLQVNISIKKFSTIKELKEFLLIDSLALVSRKFIDNFQNNPKGYIQYSFSNNNIKISIDFKDLYVKVNNANHNIITLKENSINNFGHQNDGTELHHTLLKLIIKLHYFSEEINNDIQTEFNSN